MQSIHFLPPPNHHSTLCIPNGEILLNGYEYMKINTKPSLDSIVVVILIASINSGLNMKQLFTFLSLLCIPTHNILKAMLFQSVVAFRFCTHWISFKATIIFMQASKTSSFHWIPFDTTEKQYLYSCSNFFAFLCSLLLTENSVLYILPSCISYALILAPLPFPNAIAWLVNKFHLVALQNHLLGVGMSCYVHSGGLLIKNYPFFACAHLLNPSTFTTSITPSKLDQPCSSYSINHS